MAGIMIRYWANISAAPTTDPAAESEVLEALRSRCTKISDSDARQVGSETITAAEVKKAMKGMKPNSAPGIDGLPLETFRLHKQTSAEILARLFTAMGVTGKCPRISTWAPSRSCSKRASRMTLPTTDPSPF
jgi:hypothetical protein